MTSQIGSFSQCDSFLESDEDLAGKPVDALAIKDIEDDNEIEEDIKDDDEHEEIEEDIETADTGLDLRDSNVVQGVPHLRGSYVIHEDTADEALRSARPVIDQSIKPEEDTIVLSFSKGRLYECL